MSAIVSSDSCYNQGVMTFVLDKHTTINHWLRDAAEQLADIGITSALLDAEIILSHTLRKSRTFLHAHAHNFLSLRELNIANARLDLRLDRTPIAYIIGHKEFYGRLFKVTPATLIPRPESETIIQLLGEYVTTNPAKLIDIGTGSGCLGITACLEYPHLEVTLSDNSHHALRIAEENARLLAANVTCIRSDLLHSVDSMNYRYVIANLPYVDHSWQCSPETDAEPPEALFADEGGLALIYELFDQLPRVTQVGSILILEADPRQHPQIIARAVSRNLDHLKTDGFCLAFRRAQ
ncbi:putative Modification methylase, HemK family [Candidatus Saccharimonas aalborgensis]|uniref:peptide chain release factor N(5)-glutamine methyltransferase n=2 Tax=Candidatus Saccharimonas aalborgensis TaxID=1332188 RepID=R4PW03_9BACT|nr:putative Modification methylase, HemK family [Candidatus Saccharimonas aalborgensis]